jgi:branched-chain amino acid transport system substrate-binding protein
MAELAMREQGARTMRRWFITGLMAFAAGCTVVPKAPPKTVEKPPEDTQPTGPQLPTDVARHRIALLVPLSGANAGVGESISNAANLAVLDTGGKNIRITTYDTATGAVAAAQRAMSDGNRLILGPLLAEDVKAVKPVALAAKVPLISYSNDVSIAGNGAWLMGFVPTQSIERIVAYAKAKGLTRFAGLVPNGLYGQRASAAMIKAVKESGGQLVSLQNFDRSPGAITAAVSKLAQASAYDAVLIADSGRIALQIVPLIRRSGGTKAKILGTELWNTEGSLAQNLTMQGAWFASVPDGYYNTLAGKYRTRFAKGPYRLASLGYDSVLLVNKIAANWKIGTPFPVSQLTDANGFSGIDGAFRFGKDGIAERMLEVQQIGTGGFSVISPAPRGFGQ